MGTARPAPGCVWVALALGLIWLSVSALWCVGYYRQETAKMQVDADISAHLKSVSGTLISANGGGKGMTPSWYNFTYRYPSPDGQMLSGSVTVPVEQLNLFGMTTHDATFLFAHPRPWTVEYDQRSPKLSRLHGMRFRGGSSPFTLWGGEAVGAFIGTVGFLFFTIDIFRSMWLSRRQVTART